MVNGSFHWLLTLTLLVCRGLWHLCPSETMTCPLCLSMMSFLALVSGAADAILCLEAAPLLQLFGKACEAFFLDAE